MEIKEHIIGNIKIAEVISDGIIIKNAEDGLGLLGNLYYQDFEKIIIHMQNITPDFFNLKNGIAGELLQKFSNYRVRLIIVGDFSLIKSKSIADFIFESNNGRQVNFLTTTSEALKRLST